MSLSEKSCGPCSGIGEPMPEADIIKMMDNIPGWEYTDGKIVATKVFKNHYQAMAFANSVAWISHKENHHPYMTIGYKDVKIEYWSHELNGISENDFICAAKVNEL